MITLTRIIRKNRIIFPDLAMSDSEQKKVDEGKKLLLLK